ncbi:hypothetical protein ACOME3_010202 [Neoechinorhynchus agilis]
MVWPWFCVRIQCFLNVFRQTLTQSRSFFPDVDDLTIVTGQTSFSDHLVDHDSSIENRTLSAIFVHGLPWDVRTNNHESGHVSDVRGKIKRHQLAKHVTLLLALSDRSYKRFQLLYDPSEFRSQSSHREIPDIVQKH